MAALPAATIATAGRIPYRYTGIGIPTTTLRMVTKINPLTNVVTKPVSIGRRENLPTRIGGTECAKNPATRAPPNSLKKLP